jgi:hypothetical protein
VIPSSETESRSRGRSALDRGGAPRERGRPAPEQGGVPHEGASDSRARQNLTRGGRPNHERGGVVPGRRRTPRAERSSSRGWLGRFFDGSWVRGFVLRVCLGSFVFIFYEFKRVSPGCLGDPHGRPRQASIYNPTSGAATAIWISIDS